MPIKHNILMKTNQGIYRYLLFLFIKSEAKIGKATDFLLSIDKLQSHRNSKKVIGTRVIYVYEMFLRVLRDSPSLCHVVLWVNKDPIAARALYMYRPYRDF